MNSRNGNAAAAAAAALLPQYPPALLALPDLGRRPAIMEMWELEAVAAALPAKKRRLRETFDRLAACSPAPLPFRWEDLDAYISSLQYSVTLRRHQLRELDRSRPSPAVAVAPAPAAISAPSATGDDVGQMQVLEKTSPPVPAPVLDLPAVSKTGATGGDVHKLQALEMSEPVHAPASASAPAPAAVSAPSGTGDAVRQMRVFEKSRPAPPAVLALPAVSEPAAIAGGFHKLRALQKSKPVRTPAPAPAAVSAQANTSVDVAKGKKRKASNQETEADHVATAIRVQEAQRIHEEEASPLPDTSCNGKKLRPVPRASGHDDGLAAEPNTGTDATAQVDPVISKIAAVQQEVPGPGPAAARHASSATNRARAGRLPFQWGRRCPRRPIPASAAVSTAPVAGSQAVEAANLKSDLVVVATNASRLHDGEEVKVSPRRPGHGSGGGNGLPVTPAFATQVDVDPICKITGVRHESPAATTPQMQASNVATPKVASFSLAEVEVPDVEMEIVEQEQQPHDEVPDVEMEIVEQEQQPHDEVPDVEMEIVEHEEVQALKEDAPLVADETTASPTQVKAQEAEVSLLPLAYGKGLAQPGAHAATTMPVDAGGATVRESSPAVTRDALQASAAPRSADDVHDGPDASRLAPAPAGSRGDPGKVSPVPPSRGHHGLARSGVSTDDYAVKTVAAAVAGPDHPAATRRGQNATERKATVPPSGARNKHVLQQQHMSNSKHGYHEPHSPAQRQSPSFSRNHGGRPSGSRPPVPEAQAAAWWSTPVDGRGGGSSAASAASARGLQGDGGSRGKGSARWKPTMFCNKCGCRGHLAENCRTAKHLVALYLRAKAEEEKQICYRCGCTGHWSRKCRTPKHLVDLYQKDRAAKRAARGAGSPEPNGIGWQEGQGYKDE